MFPPHTAPCTAWYTYIVGLLTGHSNQIFSVSTGLAFLQVPSGIVNKEKAWEALAVNSSYTLDLQDITIIQYNRTHN